MPLLRAIVAGEGVTVLVATHDQALLSEADRVLNLEDGKITEAPVPAAG
jgi:putative ABC transport system ATP-binding protein